MKNLLMIIKLVLLFSFLIPLQAQTTTFTFTGNGGDNKWSNPNNWDPPRVPTDEPGSQCSDVVIPEGAVVDMENIRMTIFSDINQFQNNGSLLNVYSLHAISIVNNGAIIGTEDNLFWIRAYNITNNGTIAVIGSQGRLSIQAEDTLQNNGKLEARKGTEVKAKRHLNTQNIESGGSINLYASEELRNEGEITTLDYDITTGNTNDIIITCVSESDTSEFYNTGTIQAGKGSTGVSGGSVYIEADDLRNRGNIYGSNKGEADTLQAGDISITSTYLDNAGVFRSWSSIMFMCRTFIHNPTYNDSKSLPKHSDSINENKLSEYFKIESPVINIWGKELYFGNLGAFGSGTTIIGSEWVDITTTNEEGSFMDFTQNNSAATIVSDIKITFTGNTILTPSQGMNYLCNITPQISAGGITFDGALLQSNDVSDSSGANGQLQVLIKNQGSAENDFTLTLNSTNGWVNQSFTTTETLLPWESKTVNIDYIIPSGLSEITTDSVTLNLVINLFSTETAVVLIEGIPSNSVSRREKSETIPVDFSLFQNYPNPFNPATKIKYTVPANVGDANFASPSMVILSVYDILGREITTLVNEYKPAGTYEVEFDGSKLPAGRQVLTSGIYFYVLKSGSNIQCRKMVLLK